MSETATEAQKWAANVNLHPTAKSILMALADRSDAGGRCRSTTSKGLRRWTGRSSSTITKALRDMQGLGLVEVVQDVDLYDISINIGAGIPGQDQLFERVFYSSDRSGTPGRRMKSARWHKLQAAVLARDNYTCRYCGVRNLPLCCDHMIPLSRGGTNAIVNLAAACSSCNISKRDRTPFEWEGRPQ